MLPAAAVDSVSEIVDQIGNPIQMESRPELAPLVNWGGAASLPIHRWFRYREAFSSLLIRRLGLGRRLLDPFCGCGSIMVGAAELGRFSVGLDINPLAVFVTKVKLTPLSRSQLKIVGAYLEDVDRAATSEEPWPVPSLSIAKKVFEPVILDTLLRLRTAIEAFADDSVVHDFILLAWLGALEEVGSYFKEGNGIKYRNKKRLKAGYVRRPEGDWQRARFGDDQRGFVCRSVKDRLSMMMLDAASRPAGTWSSQRVTEGSALEMHQLLEGEEFDSVVFSPPYANRFDYFESLKVELWFGGFVHSYGELGLFRKRSIRSHLGANLTRPAIEIEPLERLIALMDRDSSSWRMRVPSALRGYFDDMFHVLLQCRGLAPKGSCHVVVGNSAYAGVIVPTDVLIARLGLEAGFSSARVFAVRHLTVAPQQRWELQGLERHMRESIVVLE